MLRAARRLTWLKFDPLQVLDVLSLDAGLLLQEGGGTKEKTVQGWLRGTQVGRGEVGSQWGHAQGRGSPRVHPGLQDPVPLSWGQEWVLFRVRSGRKGGIMWKERESLLF